MPVEMAIVLTTQPITAELVAGSLVLGEDILVLGASARRYDRDHGIAVGDGLAIVRLSSEDYFVLDVQTPNEVMKGVGTEAASGTTKTLAVTGTANLTTGALTAHVDLVASSWLEVYDADGDSIGFVPVFASKT